MNFLILALVCLFAFFAYKLSSRLGIPHIIAFIALGMVFSYFNVDFGDFHNLLNLAIFALVLIVFYEGYILNLNSVKTSYRESLLMGSLGVLVTALVIAVFVNLAFGINFIEGLLLGSVLSSTDALGTFAIMRGEDSKLRGDTGPMLTFETGINDTFSKSLTFAFIATFGTDISRYPLELARLIIIGLLTGFILAYLAARILDKIGTGNNFMNTVFLLGLTFLTYGLSSELGGNGFLSVYILGLYMGNRSQAATRESLHFVEESAEIMEILYFFLLGIFIRPRDLISVLPYSLAIVIVITLLARPLAVLPIMKIFNRPKKQGIFVSFAGFKGATAIILALECYSLSLSFDLVQVVFGVVIISFILESVALRPLAHRLDMIDPDKSVTKTFNDYIYNEELGFLTTTVSKDSKWEGRSLEELGLDDQFLIASIERDRTSFMPSEETRLKESDQVLVGGIAYRDDDSKLEEILLHQDHPWLGERISSLDLDEDKKVLAIIRDGLLLVPRLSTILEEEDRLILSELNRNGDL